jgi:Pyrimidine reductase, riboflavin biosynthesis
VVALSAAEAAAPFPVLGAWCAERAVGDVLLECGPTLAGAALAQGAVDELLLYQAPLLLGASARPLAALQWEHLADAQRFVLTDVQRFGADLRLRLQVRAPLPCNGSEESA